MTRSRDAGLHGRKPMFRGIRDLVWSYFDPYVDFTGRITGYQVPDLRALGRYDWRLATTNIWKVEKCLLELPHRKLQSSNRRYERLLRAISRIQAATSSRPGRGDLPQS